MHGSSRQSSLHCPQDDHSSLSYVWSSASQPASQPVKQEEARCAWLDVSNQPPQGAYERGWFQSAISKPGMTASPLAALVATAADIAQGMAYLHERKAPC